MHEAKAMRALQGLRGVPKLYGVVTEESPLAILMSYQPGTPLQEYIDDGDSLMALLARSRLGYL